MLTERSGEQRDELALRYDDECHRALLTELAAKYVWWETPEKAVRFPDRVLIQVMNLGVFHDVRRMINALGEERLRAVVRGAKGGQFDARSWAFWNYYLDLAEPGKLPPVPQKRIA